MMGVVPARVGKSIVVAVVSHASASGEARVVEAGAVPLVSERDRSSNWSVCLSRVCKCVLWDGMSARRSNRRPIKHTKPTSAPIHPFAKALRTYVIIQFNRSIQCCGGMQAPKA